MKHFTPTLTAFAIAACFNSSAPVYANPTGAQVVSGSVQMQTSGNTLNITNSPGAIINWQQFNIDAGQTTRFIQQSAQSSVLNRVVGADPSQIHGQLLSNGQVYLINPNGILFGPNAFVDVNKLVASTLNLSDADFLAQRLRFQGNSLVNGSIFNQGHISTPLGGRVYLVGRDVRNEGIITTPSGQVLLAAGNQVELVDTAGPELKVSISASGNRAVNIGTVNAAGGRIDMFGALIEQQGVLSANSASVDASGRIVLKATETVSLTGRTEAVNSIGKGGEVRITGDAVNIAAGAQIDASGQAGGGTILIGGGQQGQDASISNARAVTVAAGSEARADALQNGDGGRVIVYSTGLTDFKGRLAARGGALSGNGGFVETSGATIRLGGRVDTSAANGRAGTWLIDPLRLCIYAADISECTSGSSPFNNASTFDGSGTGTGINNQTPASSFVSIADVNSSAGTSGISITAGELISVLPAGGMWSLPSISTGGISFSASIFYLNGSLTNVGGGRIPGVQPTGSDLGIFTFGNSTFSDLGPGNRIIFGSGAGIFGSSDLVSMSMSSANYEFAAGSRISFSRQAATSVSPNYTSLFMSVFPQTMVSTDPSTEQITSSTLVPTIRNDGLQIKADNFFLTTPSNAALTGSPLSLDVRRTSISYNYGGSSVQTVRIGDANCTVTATVDCLSGNLGRFVAGSMDAFYLTAFGFSPLTESSPSSSGVDVEIAGAVSSPAAVTGVRSSRDLKVIASVTHSAGDLALAADRDLYVQAALDNPHGAMVLEAGNALIIDAPVSSSTVIDASRFSGSSSALPSTQPAGILLNSSLTADSILLSINAQHESDSGGALSFVQLPSPAALTFGTSASVTARGVNASTLLPDTNLFGPAQRTQISSGILVELGANATIDNQAGPNVFVTSGRSKGWVIASNNGAAGEGDNLGGLSGTALDQPQFLALVCGENAACTTRASERFAASNFLASANPDSTGGGTGGTTNPGSGGGTTDPTNGETNNGGTNTGDGSRDSNVVAVAEQMKYVNDLCVLNPALCAGPDNSSNVNGGGSNSAAGNGLTVQSVAAALNTPTVSAPLTIAANLTVSGETRIATLNDMSAVASVAKAAPSTPTAGSTASPKSEPVSLALVPSSVPVDVGVRRAPSAAAQELKKEADATRAEARSMRESAQREELQVRQVETQVRKAEAEVRVVREEVRKAEADVKKAEAEVRNARTPEEKAAASRRLTAKREEAVAKQIKAEVKQAELEVKRAQAEARKTEIEARRVEAESKELRADSKALMAQARDLRSAGGRAVTEQRANAKALESDARGAVAEVKKAAAAELKAQAEVRAAQADLKQAKTPDAAQRRLVDAKDKVEQVKAELQQRRAALDQKKSDLEKAVGELKVAESRRVDERRAEMMTMFGMMASSRMGKNAMDQALALRQELKAEAFREALNLLDNKPDAVDLPACGGNAVVCVPTASPSVKLPAVDVKPTVAFLPQIERKVAVMIGVNDYADPDVPSLDTALPDAQAVGAQLQDQFGYTVRPVPNATRADIVTTLNQLAREVGPNDSVTVYYAGHGYLNEKTGAGYWIPADGKASSPANWISNRDITRLLGNIPAKQVLLVSDSCYSGSLAKEVLTGSGSASQIDPSRVLGKRSVTVLSSGGEEPVADEGKNGHSIFAYNFMNALKDVKNVGPAVSVFEVVRNGVVQDAAQQPQYGGVVSANHQPGGEFLFEVRSYK